jgi:CNT family concentrative nucleoside transporter
MPASQLFTLMTVGMAGVAGHHPCAYAGLLGERYLPFLLAAAFMSAPGGILMAKLLMPDEPPAPDELPLEGAVASRAQEASTSTPSRKASALRTSSWPPPRAHRPASSWLSQSAQWCLPSLPWSRLPTALLGWAWQYAGQPGWSFQARLAPLFAPVMYLIGIPWNEAGIAGGLFGTKIVLNEFVAFIDLGNAAGPAAALSERSRAIVTFALCGFANFSSIAIQMAVTGNLAPNQRPVIARLGLRALLGGSLANLMSAALAGLLMA